MNIFADFHHTDLFHSFKILFEKKLGYNLYRPIGMDWAIEDYWDIYKVQPVIECYLSTEKRKAIDVVSELPPLGDIPWARYLVEMMKMGEVHPSNEEGLFLAQDNSQPGEISKCITFDKFKSMKFDILISSVPQHFDRFEKLIELYQPQAKHIFHMGFGNAPWPVPQGAKNLILHSNPTGFNPDINHLFIHQEFNLSTFFFQEPKYQNNVVSYVHFPDSWKLMREVQSLLPKNKYSFTTIGDFRGPQANIMPVASWLSSQIRSSSFTWHIKPGGESYGHILFNSYACGRPAIINLSDFKDKMGGKLLEDGITCISVDNRTPKEIASILREYEDPEKHRQICNNAYQRFIETVDFDNETHKVIEFIRSLK